MTLAFFAVAAAMPTWEQAKFGISGIIGSRKTSELLA